MELTDGKVAVKAMEFKQLTSLRDQILPPGTKVLLSNATVKAGVILLEDKSFKVSLLSCCDILAHLRLNFIKLISD